MVFHHGLGVEEDLSKFSEGSHLGHVEEVHLLVREIAAEFGPLEALQVEFVFEQVARLVSGEGLRAKVDEVVLHPDQKFLNFPQDLVVKRVEEQNKVFWLSNARREDAKHLLGLVFVTSSVCAKIKVALETAQFNLEFLLFLVTKLLQDLGVNGVGRIDFLKDSFLDLVVRKKEVLEVNQFVE